MGRDARGPRPADRAAAPDLHRGGRALAGGARLRSIVRAAALAAAFAAWAPDARAQEPPPVEPGDRVRVTYLRAPGAGERRVEGTLTHWDDARLRLNQRAGGIVADYDIPRADLLRLERPAPRPRGQGAKRGAWIGAIAGTVAGLGIGIAMANDDFFDAGAGEVLAVGGIFGAAGGGAGALVGAAFPGTGWREVPLDGP